ncbi:MAG: succinate dehydrogenase [Bacteroidota bacterium]|nr:succinate dehydrogenase [Bacteroidota bacterium]
MTGTNATDIGQRFGQTTRTDNWWASPLIVFICLSSFVIYTTWAAFQGEFYSYGNYLSPLYSPELFGNSPHSLFGPKPGFWPSFLPFSPALLILWAPGLFRLSCYYYRGAYYKAFFRDPVACTVSESRKKYTGEMTFPLFLHNIHRYFMYIALIFIIILSYDVWRALWFIDPQSGVEHFGLGLGSLILATNVVLLGGYTFGCHSLRHIVGGVMDRLSGSPTRMKMYQCVTCFNKKHMLWAWMSLCSVGFSDVYIRLCAMGIWADWKIIF